MAATFCFPPRPFCLGCAQFARGEGGRLFDVGDDIAELRIAESIGSEEWPNRPSQLYGQIYTRYHYPIRRLRELRERRLALGSGLKEFGGNACIAAGMTAVTRRIKEIFAAQAVALKNLCIRPRGRLPVPELRARRARWRSLLNRP